MRALGVSMMILSDATVTMNVNSYHAMMKNAGEWRMTLV